MKSDEIVQNIRGLKYVSKEKNISGLHKRSGDIIISFRPFLFDSEIASNLNDLAEADDYSMSLLDHHIYDGIKRKKKDIPLFLRSRMKCNQ